MADKTTFLTQTQPSSSDFAYRDWQQRKAMLSTINNWLSMFFLCVHPLIMVVAYDYWANWHIVMIIHSGLQLILGLFCWALPDPKYQSFLKKRLWVFYLLSFINVGIFALGVCTGAYFYYNGPAL